MNYQLRPLLKINDLLILRAFTLFELLITIALIAILTCLTLPAWHLLKEREARHGVRSLLLGSLEQARSAALQQKANTWILFCHAQKPTPDEFRILQETEQGEVKPLTTWIHLPSSVTFLPTSQTVMSEAPPPTVVQAARNTSSIENENKNEILGSLQYNSQGVIIIPAIEGNELTLNFSTQLKNTSGHQVPPSLDSIHISRWTGRAL